MRGETWKAEEDYDFDAQNRRELRSSESVVDMMIESQGSFTATVQVHRS